MNVKWDRKYRIVAVDDLQTSDAYQRTVSKAQVNKMARTFDVDALGCLLVGERQDGSLWVVDGLQRLSTLKTLGIVKAPCVVFQSTGLRHEARIFRLSNNNRRVNPIRLFAALLVERDDRAIAIKAAVEREGFTLKLTTNGSSKGWPELVCIKSIEGIVERSGIEHLDLVLAIVNQCWNKDRDAIRGDMLSGFSLFVDLAMSHGKRPRAIARAFKKTSPLDILRYVDIRKKLMSGSRVKEICNACLEYWNQCKSASHRMDSEETAAAG